MSSLNAVSSYQSTVSDALIVNSEIFFWFGAECVCESIVQCRWRKKM